MTTNHMSTLDAKEGFAELLHRVSHNKERIILTRRGKEIAAIVPLEDLHRLHQSQSKNDLEEAVDALQESRNRGTMTLEEMKIEIGGPS